MNNRVHPRRTFSSKPYSAGFTMIEVMIAILVLAIGLLGFALLQTMSVRFAQSANQRTQATNLAYDLLDQMRTNRLLAAQYSAATFNSGAAVATPCTRDTGTVTITQNITRWQCQVRDSLGAGSSATVTYNNGVANVTINWGDQRGENVAARRTGAYDTGVLELETRL